MLNLRSNSDQGFRKTVTSRPGVYRMLNADQEVIYVGKAANLKKRITSYFTGREPSPKTRSMVAQIRDILVTVTRTEGEALLLESDLIKELKPRYNIVFRDDKSYPFLHLSSVQDVPRLSFHRGSRRGSGRYFGPFPGAGAARRTLNLVQKLFRLRQCDDSYFRNRTRPCLQHQIQRCSAPCVGFIEPEEYRRDVEHAVMFLEGRNEEIIEALNGPMRRAAETLEFERAAHYRDQIASLRRIQEERHVAAPENECDVIACVVRDGQACIQAFYFRGGRNLGNRASFPRHEAAESDDRILAAFLTQHYLTGRGRNQVPARIYVSHLPPGRALLEKVLSGDRRARVRIVRPIRGKAAAWVRLARENAALALAQHLSIGQRSAFRLAALGNALGGGNALERIECFDVSHTSGEATVASCVVFGPGGALKGEYRRFNIEGIAPGDDYAAMRQAIERRYARTASEQGKWPDLILIDGGKGQVSAAEAALRGLKVDDLKLIGVAKGPARRPGQERLVLTGSGQPLRLDPDNPALHLIQEIRDEAHRFAITGHRSRRSRRRRESPLQQIDGIGSRRRQSLLRHFGGLQGVERAGVEELAKVPGINKNLAQRIYSALHGG
ncbi:MAG: excinuclease ABC subunit UvrC [Gammaproteobacteria bacterium]|nr:excinuclease ABC subunit UvrC [Gammaproteobacteria bacterium]